MGGGYLLIILILLVVTNGITYGASQLTSESVSYQKKDGELTTVKSALDELITKSSKVDDLEEKAKVYKYAYLYDVAKVGDYVDYNAGDWKDSSKMPTENGSFGGYNAGTSKNASVEKCGGGTTNLNGWRVLSKNEKTKTVTIVHAGEPECYYHEYRDSNTGVINLDNRAKEYMNEYAQSSRSIKKEDIETITPQSNTLRMIGDWYWLATVYSNYDLYSVYASGIINGGGNSYAFGYRPVVELKSSVFTPGKGTDMFSQDAWQLVEMK